VLKRKSCGLIPPTHAISSPKPSDYDEDADED